MLKNIENASEAIKQALYLSRENLIKLLFYRHPASHDAEKSKNIREMWVA